ncbi:MAG: PDZ domain-containing protein [Bacteroidales bacterium]|nr:PDZ domain-containing protein [Bacteroidales bacterium]
MKILRFSIIVFLFLSTATAAVSQQKGYYRSPAISGNEVVFTAEGDLWKFDLVSKNTQRLTTDHGMELQSAFSRDGKYIAFIGEYEGPSEVYIIPSTGGKPRRLTWEENSPQISQWTGDGKILYSTNYYSTLPSAQLLELDPESAASTLIPLAQADQGTFTDEGELVFTRLRKQSSHTKRYIGGTAQSIWKFDGNNEAVHLTADYEGTSKDPMYYNGRIYFLSDRDGTMNIWSMNKSGEDMRQHTFSSGWDLYEADMDNGRIVCQKGADILLYDINTDKEEILDIELFSDFDQKHIQWITDPDSKITSVNISHNGEDVVITSRGRVFNFPVNGERWSEITRKYGIRYEDASFSADSDDILMLSDESGEFEIWKAGHLGLDKPGQVTSGSANLITGYSVSPDEKYIAFAEKDNRLMLFDKNTDKSAIIDENDFSGFMEPFSWSHDNKWIAYVNSADNRNRVIKLYNVDEEKSYVVSTDRLDSYNPRFSTDGRWLYFISDRTFNNQVGSPWGSRQPEPYFERTAKIYALALDGEAEFPFLEQNELKQEEKEKENAKGKEKEKENAGKIDFDGMEGRLYEVPAAAADYRDLYVTENHLVWMQSSAGSRGGTVQSLKITNEPDNKPKTLANGISSFSVSGDGKKILLRNRSGIYVMETSAPKLDTSKHKLEIRNWAFNIDPVEDWKQMFKDAWRMERDYFYDPGMHGLDWDSVYDKYSALLPRITDRHELDDLMAQMISELSTLHMFVRGGDKRTAEENITMGYLGADLHKDASGVFIIDHIYLTDPDYPDEQSPLAVPWLDVKEGDAIISIDGIDVNNSPSINKLLTNKAGMQVRIKFRKPDGISYEAIVKPINSRDFSNLRYSEWEYTRNEEVEKSSDNRIGYIHLRAMGGNNYTEWIKGFYPNYRKEGLIIDVRNNRGGNIDSWILEKLLRKAWFFWAPRAGEPYWNMQYAFRGHMVVLINENTASDGEAFAEGFRRLGMGDLIGTRTWGGEIWLSQRNRLVDNGIATAAENGVYSPEGEWLIEGYGVVPDIEVDNLPHETYRGKDAQLEAAIEHLMKLMEKEPVKIPPIPERPDKSFEYK